MTELRPPEQWAHLPWHFVKSRVGTEKTLEWAEEHWKINDHWLRPVDMARNGWRYLGPAIAITADDAQIRTILAALHGSHVKFQSGDPEYKRVRAGLTALIGEK